MKSIIDLNKLRNYPQGTFGRAWVDTVEFHNLQPINSGLRRSQLHDGLHVLLDYGIDFIDEARVQVFLLGTENKYKPVNAMLLSLFVLKVLQQLKISGLNQPKSYQIIFRALKQAYQRGQNSTLNPDTWEVRKVTPLTLSSSQKILPSIVISNAFSWMLSPFLFTTWESLPKNKGNGVIEV